MKTLSRRHFVKYSAVGAGAAVLGEALLPRALGARVASDKIRVGIVGCGGRGLGALRDCLAAAPGVEIVALADLFQRQIDVVKSRLKLTDVASFSGFDAFQKIYSVDFDLVILAGPPGFRPLHFAAAVAAGRHVFIEKPVAVDPVGCRVIIETARLAKAKGLAVVAGT